MAEEGLSKSELAGRANSADREEYTRQVYSTPGDLPNETDIGCPGGNKPIKFDTMTAELLRIWKELNQENRERILADARGLAGLRCDQAE